jgi:uncharacterized protein YgiM (DUF1202 family)
MIFPNVKNRLFAGLFPGNKLKNPGLKYSMILYLLFMIMKVNVLQAEELNYCIVNGSKVNIRSEPGLKGRVLRQAYPNEMVYIQKKSESKDKIGEDSDYWYEIATSLREQGWIYGRYLKFIDRKNEHDRILDYCLHDKADVFLKKEKTVYVLTKILYNIKLEELTPERFYIFRHAVYDKIPNNSYTSSLVYEKINNKLSLIIHDIGESLFFFDNKYIITSTDSDIYVYDITDYNSYLLKSGYSQQAICSLNTTDYYMKNKFDVRIEYNNATKIAVVHYKDEKNGKEKLEKYELKDGKFQRID